jgi:tellurite resistance protein TerC
MLMKEAVGWSLFWLSLGLSFTGVVYFIYQNNVLGIAGAAGRGAEAALLYITGYLLEESLSVDNLFVIAMIFESFKVPAKDRHRVLFWGIIGALVLRGIMIAGGIFLVTRFTWLFYVFGAYLLYIAVSLLRTKDEEAGDAKNSLFVRAARRVLPITTDASSGRFSCRVNGKFYFTPLILALCAVEAADVVFALDSIPAILSITTDTFIVFTSNVFAILGLRSLFFVLSGMMDKFEYLKYSLAVILGFIGFKMVMHAYITIPNQISLVLIALALFIGIVASFYRSRSKKLK